MEQPTPDIMDLITRAPWREAVTYRDTWPHEYVVVKKDGQQELLAAFCERISRGEGVECRFFHQKRHYLFLGDYKYWTMTECPDIDLNTEDCVLNRALLYRDRRDFVIRPGDTGRREETTMTASEEAIEQLPVRTMWQDEARDFTPWLADNLDLLGNELGMKLELVQKELSVGSFSLDIKARGADDGVVVAIENQLESTDHGHLGQLLTYAAGCGAHVAIWVAPEFWYEHAQALHRLNEWTSERIGFYGVKVEVVKKPGHSPPEPRLRKVVYPGGWNEGLTLRSMEKPEHIRRYDGFFQPLIGELTQAGFDERPVQRFGHTDRHFRSRLHSGIRYAASLEGKNDAWVTLHIEMEDKERTKQIFDALKKDKEQIERCIEGEDWRWYRHSPYFFSSINLRRDGSIDSPEKHDEIRAWMAEYLPKLKEVMDPRLEKILTEETR